MLTGHGDLPASDAPSLAHRTAIPEQKSSLSRAIGNEPVLVETLVSMLREW
jgi:hypothetical protein